MMGGMRNPRPRSLLPLLSILAVLVSCSSTPAVVSPPRTTASIPPPTTSAPPGPTFAQPSKIVLVIMENHSYDQILGSSQMPFLNSAIVPHAISLTHMQEDSSPSLPNYAWMSAGTACGSEGSDMAFDLTCRSVFDQMDAAGIPWMVFAEGYGGTPASCDLSQFTPADPENDYARKHVPPLLFASTSSKMACTRHMANFPRDTPGDGAPPVANFSAVHLPAFTIVVPNLCHDMHNDAAACGSAGGGPQAADVWLRFNWRDLIEDAGPQGTVILTWDESEGADPTIPTFVAGERVPGGIDVGRPSDHGSTLRAIQDAFGLPCLQDSCHATPLPVQVRV